MVTDQTTLEQQLTRAWHEYIDRCLTHDEAGAKLAMSHIDNLLDRFPQPQPSS